MFALSMSTIIIAWCAGQLCASHRAITKNRPINSIWLSTRSCDCRLRYSDFGSNVNNGSRMHGRSRNRPCRFPGSDGYLPTQSPGEKQRFALPTCPCALAPTATNVANIVRHKAAYNLISMVMVERFERSSCGSCVGTPTDDSCHPCRWNRR